MYFILYKLLGFRFGTGHWSVKLKFRRSVFFILELIVVFVPLCFGYGVLFMFLNLPCPTIKETDES